MRTVRFYIDEMSKFIFLRLGWIVICTTFFDRMNTISARSAVLIWLQNQNMLILTIWHFSHIHINQIDFIRYSTVDCVLIETFVLSILVLSVYVSSRCHGWARALVRSSRFKQQSFMKYWQINTFPMICTCKYMYFLAFWLLSCVFFLLTD